VEYGVGLKASIDGRAQQKNGKPEKLALLPPKKEEGESSQAGETSRVASRIEWMESHEARMTLASSV
jgi:hypothetical protein